MFSRGAAVAYVAQLSIFFFWLSLELEDGCFFRYTPYVLSYSGNASD